MPVTKECSLILVGKGGFSYITAGKIGSATFISTGNFLNGFMILILLFFRRVNVRGKVLTKINHKLGIKTNLRAKGIKVISFHIALNIIMLIIYSGFNTFIDFPVFSVLLDPLNEIASFFNASCLEYPARGGIQHLLILTRKPGMKICKYNIFR